MGGTIGENNNDEVCSLLSTDCCGMQSLQVGEDAIKAQTVDCVFVLILDTSMYKEDMYKSGGGGYRWW